MHPTIHRSSMRAVVLALLAGVAAGFVPAAPAAARVARTVVKGAENMEGASAPLGYWDPAGIAEYGSDRTLAWFRAAELKHGRVAMAATVGWIIQETGITFPGKISLDGTLQILFTVGMFEFYSETIKPHYMSGGKVGYAGKIWDPIGFTRGVPEDVLATKRLAELNNGRLAMIGAISFFAASSIDGSVPALPNGW